MWRVSDFRPSEKLFLPRTGEEKITSEQYTHMLNATANVKKIFLIPQKILVKFLFCYGILTWQIFSSYKEALYVTQSLLGKPSKKKYGIIWEFLPNVGPPPLLGTPRSKWIFLGDFKVI